MDKGIDLQISEYKQDVSNLINKPELSWGIKQMIFNEALIAVTNANISAITAERKAFEEGAKKDGICRSE